MKRILTGLFAILLVLSLALTVMTVSVSAMMDKAAEQTPAPIAADAGAAGKTDMTFGERLAEAGQVTLLGMGMVFAVLALLWGVLELFRVIMQKSEKKKKTAEPVIPEKSVPAPAPVTAEPTPSEAGDDGDLTAAITAAVAAYLASEGDAAYAGGFRVVSFRRSGNGSAWNK